MPEELFRPLSRLLDLIAPEMCAGTMSGGFGEGSRNYDWPKLVNAQLSAEYLRRKVEGLTRGKLTVRLAGTDLRSDPPDNEVLLFTVAVCVAPRPEGVVGRLRPGDSLYMVTAPDAPSRGFYLRSVRRPA